MPGTWRPCSSCKKPIPLGGRYWTCSVSTCNRARFELVFCSVACWDAHVPTMNHRNAWCTEHRAPTTVEVDEPARRRLARPDDEPADPEQVLIIASRMKEYIQKKAGFNTSGDVMDELSAIVRSLTDDAIVRARREGRKTVMARDYRPS